MSRAAAAEDTDCLFVFPNSTFIRRQFRSRSGAANFSHRREGSYVVSHEQQPVGADAFAERLIDVLNSGMLALTISLGTETGLFDVLAGLPPSTSDEISGGVRAVRALRS